MSYLRRLLGLCEHDWIEHGSLPGQHTGLRATVQRCTKCGDYRTVWH